MNIDMLRWNLSCILLQKWQKNEINKLLYKNEKRWTLNSRTKKTISYIPIQHPLLVHVGSCSLWTKNGTTMWIFFSLKLESQLVPCLYDFIAWIWTHVMLSRNKNFGGKFSNYIHTRSKIISLKKGGCISSPHHGWTVCIINVDHIVLSS